MRPDAAATSWGAARWRAADRYRELLAVINGQQVRPSRAPDLQWLLAAIGSYPA
jgi:hypothetical protein